VDMAGLRPGILAGAAFPVTILPIISLESALISIAGG
jgi:hypothetical protein